MDLSPLVPRVIPAISRLLLTALPLLVGQLPLRLLQLLPLLVGHVRPGLQLLLDVRSPRRRVSLGGLFRGLLGGLLAQDPVGRASGFPHGRQVF